MSWSCCEPTLAEILSDPIVAAVMEADAVDLRELGAMLSRIAHGLRATVGEDGGTKTQTSALAKQRVPQS